jgi:hypothetical protein
MRPKNNTVLILLIAIAAKEAGFEGGRAQSPDIIGRINSVQIGE